MALKVECVVDSRVDGQKPLRRSRRFEALHLLLSSSHHLMGVFRSVVLAQPLIMTSKVAELPPSSATRWQLVGDD